MLTQRGLRMSTFKSSQIYLRSGIQYSQRSPQQSLTHSNIDNGFILSMPKLPNPATSDPAYNRILSWYLPERVLSKVRPRLEAFGNEAVSDEVNQWISNAERQTPYVKTRNVWGEKYAYDRLVTSQGWKELGRWGAKNGVIAAGYEDEFGEYRRLVQHAFNYIYSASSAVYSCPVSMTSGAARLMFHQLRGLPQDHPFHEVYKRLTAREGNWISSQWMTERPGGSDVQNSETVAVHSPLSDSSGTLEEGDWLVSGYKFFCSAADCDIALMLAKTESGQLSLFLAPTKLTVKRFDGVTEKSTNGILFHRLKNKMGTKELPTAELELKDTRAWLVGPVDRGIATIATLLNVTRTHNFITALSCWRRGMAMAKSFALVRTTINQPLATFPMHLRLLASMEVKFRGLLQLAFFTTSLLSFADNGVPHNLPQGYSPTPDTTEQIKVVQRTLTALGKAVICKVSCISLQECQEAMGGVGYMDEPDEPEFNISRLYRDTAANMTWEGTTNVLASEVVRHLKNGANLELFDKWFSGKVLHNIYDEELRLELERAWGVLMEKLTGGDDLADALAEGRETMFSLAWVVSGSLLAHDAQRDGNEMVAEVARRWVLDKTCGVADFAHPLVLNPRQSEGIARKQPDRRMWDCRLVWGVGLPQDAALGYRETKKPVTGAPEQLAAKL